MLVFITPKIIDNSSQDSLVDVTEQSDSTKIKPVWISPEVLKDNGANLPEIKFDYEKNK